MTKKKNKENTMMEKLWNQPIMHYRGLRALDKYYLKKKKNNNNNNNNNNNTNAGSASESLPKPPHGSGRPCLSSGYHWRRRRSNELGSTEYKPTAVTGPSHLQFNKEKQTGFCQGTWSSRSSCPTPTQSDNTNSSKHQKMGQHQHL